MEYILVGGGEINTQRNGIFLRKLVAHINKTNLPNFLFISSASSDNETYCDAIKETFQNKFSVKVLGEFNKDKSEKYLEWADIIFIGGGDTEKLVNYLESISFKTSVDSELLIGFSAGAIALCESGYSRDKSLTIKGLNILNVSVEPHATFSDIKSKPIQLADGTSLIYKNNKLVQIIEDE